MADLSSTEPGFSITHIFFKRLLSICAFAYTPVKPENRLLCISLAFITLSRMVEDNSPTSVEDNSLNPTGVTSTCKSILSSNGPEILLRYFCTAPGGQLQALSGWL